MTSRFCPIKLSIESHVEDVEIYIDYVTYFLYNDEGKTFLCVA